MTKIIVCGCFGRLGAVICKLAEKEPLTEIVAGVDITPADGGLTFPTYGEISQCTIDGDVIVCCLPPTADADILALIAFSVAKKIPLVMCTTALSSQAEDELQSAKTKTAILRSPNMSLGINLLSNMMSKAARLLYNARFDIEIIEKHHNQKLDAPSGTAVMLAETINAALGGEMKMVNDRSCEKATRDRNEIGLHALRGGSIVGEHSVVFAGLDEVVEFTHIAQSRDAFAVGTLKAAIYIKNKPAGMYSMQDLINDI
ncbi:MAG: 4-hydroxy-tetrahydrodipicolinate reductase [Defluviitaleaceae bacterium]|nr:4-hydroxy-tetrahydrodipicolinate reductase [Defluviitaleaceae bacterium]